MISFTIQQHPRRCPTHEMAAFTRNLLLACAAALLVAGAHAGHDNVEHSCPTCANDGTQSIYHYPGQNICKGPFPDFLRREKASAWQGRSGRRRQLLRLLPLAARHSPQ